LKALYNTSDLSDISITRKEFIKLTRLDKSYLYVLKVLEEHVEELANEQHDRLLALKSAFIRKSLQIRTSVKQDNAADRPMERIFAPMAKVMDMVKMWWNELDSAHIGIVRIGVAGQYVTAKRFTPNIHEAIALLTSQGPVYEGKYVTENDFEKIFLKPVFKGALANIAHGLSSGEFSDLTVPLGLKIAAYQRRLLFAGLKVSQGRLTAEGMRVVQAVQEYRKKLGSP
jgi:hypothetical protein